MKRLLLITTMLVLVVSSKAQFSYFGTTTGDIITSLSNSQKIGTLDGYARDKSLTWVKHQHAVPTASAKSLYALFANVNTSADTTLRAHPTVSDYSLLLDSLESWYADEEILRSWLDAIMTKKVNYCTDPAVLAPLNNNQRWAKYLELLRQQ